MSDYGIMKGNEFIRKVKKLGRKNGIPVKFVARRGKGSHGTLFYGDKFTIVRNPKDELKTGAMHAMLDQLGLTLDDLINV
jgi:mRNA interferase HicA